MAKKSKVKEVEEVKDSSRMGDAELLAYLRIHMPHDPRIPVLEEKV